MRGAPRAARSSARGEPLDPSGQTEIVSNFPTFEMSAVFMSATSQHHVTTASPALVSRPAWSPESPLEMRLSLTELVPQISATFGLEGVVPGPMILACLQIIANRADPRDRWIAIFNSPLGIALAAPGRDMNTAVNWVLAALPPARS
jgi:hypothetical protein